jgi:hypothetical protein
MGLVFFFDRIICACIKAGKALLYFIIPVACNYNCLSLRLGTSPFLPPATFKNISDNYTVTLVIYHKQVPLDLGIL